MTQPKILIVDDDEHIQSLISGILDKQSYQSKSAGCGESCLKMVEQFEPDLILLDVAMKGMTGIETCELLRKDPHMHAVPIVIVSAYTEIEDQLLGFRAGADAYVTKPINPDEVVSTISSQLSLYDERRRISTKAISSTKAYQAALTATLESKKIQDTLYWVLSSESLIEIGQLIADDLKMFGLKACVQLRTNWDVHNFGCRGDSFEARLMKQAHGQQHKVVHVNNRTMVNYPHLSILALNMPINNEKLCQRYIDHLSFIGNCMSTKIDTLLLEQVTELGLRESSALDTMNTGRHDIEKIAKTYQSVVQGESELLERCRLEMHDKLQFLNLESHHENAIMKIFDDCMDDVNEQNKNHFSLNQHFFHLLETFVNRPASE